MIVRLVFSSSLVYLRNSAALVPVLYRVQYIGRMIGVMSQKTCDQQKKGDRKALTSHVPFTENRPERFNTIIRTGL